VKRLIRLSMPRRSFRVITFIDAELVAPWPWTVRTDAVTPGCAEAAAGTIAAMAASAARAPRVLVIPSFICLP
jgi:hypothetical protein